MRRLLVAGAGGMLGQDLLGVLRDRDDFEVRAATRSDLDITDISAAMQAVEGCDVVVNCAAWTAVDDAEKQEGQAFAVNAVGATNLARACARHGAWMAHISTDYVFAGDATEPYAEDAPVAPRTAYGRTKAAGEWGVRAELPDRHWILRTAWLYGEHGNNFVKTMARLERERETVDVVDDQFGQPTWTRDLSVQILRVLDSVPDAGVYHATSQGSASWFELARAVFGLLGADPSRVRPAGSKDMVRPAPRPPWSVLGHDRWDAHGIRLMRSWNDAIIEKMHGFRPV